RAQALARHAQAHRAGTLHAVSRGVHGGDHQVQQHRLAPHVPKGVPTPGIGRRMSGASMENGSSTRKTYWVAGATGFLGSHLVQGLKEHGHSVIAVSRRGGEVAGIPVRPLDLLDSAAVAESARGVDGAFIAAGRVSRDKALAEVLHRDNVLALRSALTGLQQAGVRRVVVASTSGTIAVSTDPNAVPDETARAPLELIARWPYY